MKHTPHPYHAKLKRVLARMGDLYTLNDILSALAKNEMQSFVEGESVALTRIAIYPRAKVVEVLAVALGKSSTKRVSCMTAFLIFASEVGARVIQAYGRQGWLHDRPAARLESHSRELRIQQGCRRCRKIVGSTTENTTRRQSAGCRTVSAVKLRSGSFGIQLAPKRQKVRRRGQHTPKHTKQKFGGAFIGWGISIKFRRG